MEFDPNLSLFTKLSLVPKNRENKKFRRSWIVILERITDSMNLISVELDWGDIDC